MLDHEEQDKHNDIYSKKLEEMFADIEPGEMKFGAPCMIVTVRRKSVDDLMRVEDLE